MRTAYQIRTARLFLWHRGFIRRCYLYTGICSFDNARVRVSAVRHGTLRLLLGDGHVQPSGLIHDTTFFRSLYDEIAGSNGQMISLLLQKQMLIRTSIWSPVWILGEFSSYSKRPREDFKTRPPRPCQRQAQAPMLRRPFTSCTSAPSPVSGDASSPLGLRVSRGPRAESLLYLRSH